MKKKEAAGFAVYSVVKIVVIILVVMVIYRLGSMAFSYGERIFGEPPMEDAPGTDIVITVSSEDSMKDIADKMESAGLIRDAGLFVLQEKLAGYKEGVKAGTYTLNTAMTSEEMIQTMAASSDEGDADNDNG
nr:endolytic transglycosylase MltG [uncultured Eisenbergiella sp.]